MVDFLNSACYYILCGSKSSFFIRATQLYSSVDQQCLDIDFVLFRYLPSGSVASQPKSVQRVFQNGPNLCAVGCKSYISRKIFFPAGPHEKIILLAFVTISCTCDFHLRLFCMVTQRSLNFVTLSIVSSPILMFGRAGHDLVNPIHISFVLSVFNSILF